MSESQGVAIKKGSDDTGGAAAVVAAPGAVGMGTPETSSVLAADATLRGAAGGGFVPEVFPAPEPFPMPGVVPHPGESLPPSSPLPNASATAASIAPVEVYGEIDLVDLADADLEGVRVVDADPELEGIRMVEDRAPEVGVRTRAPSISPSQDFQEGNQGHWDTKPKGYYFWGFALCSCIVLFPFGAGFAVFFVPAQFASFGLCAFWKRGQTKVWVWDSKSNPGDKVVTPKGADRLAEMVGNPDAVVTPADMMKAMTGDDPKAIEDLGKFFALLEKQGVAPEQIAQLQGVLGQGYPMASVEILRSPELGAVMGELEVATDPTSKKAAMEKMVQVVQGQVMAGMEAEKRVAAPAPKENPLGGVATSGNGQPKATTHAGEHLAKKAAHGKDIGVY